jgi:hypothetical protein
VSVALLCASPAALFAQLLPSGDEFQVNTYTVGRQSLADVAAGAAGDFVVVWESYGQDGDWPGVFGRRFDDAGAPLASEFQVNTFTELFQYRAAIARRPGGGFIVTWVNAVIDTDVFLRRFDAAGAAEGAELQANASSGYHADPAVAVDAAGGFVVAWSGYDSSSAGIFAQRFDSDGDPQGTEFQVNVFTPGMQNRSSVAAGAGGFVFSWTSSGQDGSGSGVFARRYDSGGVAQSGEFRVNEHTPSGQEDSRVSADAAGNFVVVWSGGGGRDGSGFGIFARRYDSAGASLGAEFQVNGYTSGDQIRPSVAMGALGDFVIAWDSAGVGIGSYEVFARAFHRSGEPDGDAVQVNTYTVDFQVFPQVAAGGDGSFVVVWESAVQDGYLNGVFGRRFTRAGTPVGGEKLLLRTPSDPSRNKLVFLSADPSLATAANAAEDPRCAPLGSGSLAAGATLRVAGAGGSFAIDLPCVNWSASSSGDRYRYRDATGATCKTVLVRAGRKLKAVCKGAQVAYLLGAAQGDVHVTLATGAPAANAKYCSTFGPSTAATVVRDGSDGKVYKALDAAAGPCP